jgi:hypothetical protein
VLDHPLVSRADDALVFLYAQNSRLNIPLNGVDEPAITRPRSTDVKYAE